MRGLTTVASITVRPANRVLKEWLHELVADPIFIDESRKGLNLEARENLWGFRVDQDESPKLERCDVLDFLTAVQEARNQQILERFGRSHPMVLYCWVDVQVGELRFSLVSVLHGRLPFGVPIEETDDAGAIADVFLADTYQEGIPLEEFRVATQEDADLDERPRLSPLPVWSKVLPEM